jgi:hypothetical protein
VKKIVLLLVLVLLLTAGAVQGEEGLSRGEFAAMLVEACKMESALSPADLLVQKGIMKGYPDGELYLERGITRLEAVTLVAKTLGVSEVVVVEPADGELLLNEGHWGYAFYSWLDRFGLMEGNPEQLLTKEEGKAFLDSIFSSDPAALAKMEESQASTKTINTLRSVISGYVNMVPRPGVEGAEEIPPIAFQMRAVQEMIMPGTMHQTTVMETEIPEVGKQELATEMYLVDGKIYQKLPSNIETGEMQWVRYPEEMFPNLEQMMSAEDAASVTPSGLEDYLYYRLLGTAEMNGEEVYEIVTYGRVDDFTKFMEAAAGQLGSNQQIQGLLEMGVSMIESMSFWGIQYIGVQDSMTKSADMYFIINFADELAGTPNPIEALQMKMKIEEMSYNEDLEIVLPDEARDAPLMEMPEPAELPETPADAEETEGTVEEG